MNMRSFLIPYTKNSPIRRMTDASSTPGAI